jgi:four helix bundle protein
LARPKSYRELIVWQKAMALARKAYSTSHGLPSSEAFGLLSQIRRAAVSVPSNIAEGHGRLTDSQFRHFLGNARGSLNEMLTQVELARDLGYLEEKSMQELTECGSEVARLIDGLIAVLGETKAVGGRNANSANNAHSANSAGEGFRS